jgi:hypothetical protein
MNVNAPLKYQFRYQLYCLRNILEPKYNAPDTGVEDAAVDKLG